MSRTAAKKPRLIVEVDLEFRRRVRMAAAAHDQSVREYILAAVTQALAAESDTDLLSWGALSSSAFSRDWNSEEDAVYEQT